MTDKSYFESRTGKVSCTDEEVFNFVTDIRNFGQFIPEDMINGWHAEQENCSFNVSMIGAVSFRLAEKVMFKKVVFNGDALKKEDFSIELHIAENGTDPVTVKVSLQADLNPMLKMMAAKPIEQFLENLVKEMESFNGWGSVRG